MSTWKGNPLFQTCLSPAVALQRERELGIFLSEMRSFWFLPELRDGSAVGAADQGVQGRHHIHPPLPSSQRAPLQRAHPLGGAFPAGIRKAPHSSVPKELLERCPGAGLALHAKGKAWSSLPAHSSVLLSFYTKWKILNHLLP